MENEKEETLNEDVETSENNEELDSQETEETNEEEETEQSDDSPTLEDFEQAQAKLKELEEKNKQLYARLKKNEQLTNKETKQTTGSDEEKLLKLAKLANQLDEEDLELLKTINGASLEEKVTNPLFKSYKAQKDKKKRSDASALRPSSSGTSSAIGVNKPDLSPEEHKKLWEKSMGR